MSFSDQLADAIGSTNELLIRFLEGFDETNATAQQQMSTQPFES